MASSHTYIQQDSRKNKRLPEVWEPLFGEELEMSWLKLSNSEPDHSSSCSVPVSAHTYDWGRACSFYKDTEAQLLGCKEAYLWANTYILIEF